MLCFKDQTFCSARCANFDCFRNFTDEVHQQSRQWWAHDPDNAPIAFSDFSDKCSEYRPKTNQRTAI